MLSVEPVCAVIKCWQVNDTAVRMVREWSVVLQSRDTGPELFVEVLGTLAAACDALSNSSSSSLGQLISIGEMMGLMQACFVPGGYLRRK